MVYFVRDADNSVVAKGVFSATVERVGGDDEVVFASATFDEAVTAGGSSLGSVSVTAFGLPLKKVDIETLPTEEVVPCGVIAGVRINTAGLLVLNLGDVGTAAGSARPLDGKIKSGDVITAVNGAEVYDRTVFQSIVENSGGAPLKLSVKRGDESFAIDAVPVKAADGAYRLGLWVRDGTQGLGTITYYNPTTNAFGALGHGIMDVDTKRLMTLRKGQLLETAAVSVRKGKKGAPGELEGALQQSRVIGAIESNTAVGLYGHITQPPTSAGTPVKTAAKSETHEGPAKILSDVGGGGVKEYDIFIESVTTLSNGDDGKSIILRITDRELLNKTNGIVQGMSGSPIIQDGRLVGAVTHVFVQNPARGYGVFIESMLRQNRR